LGVRGPKSKFEENSFVEFHMENFGQKWLDFIEKQKRSNLKEHRDRQTDGDTDIQSQ